jgi:hypothetical protein
MDSLKNYAKAFECFDYIKNIEPSDDYYHLTCWCTRQNKTDEALADFVEALKNGFSDYKHITEDNDLNLIRNTDKFKALLKQYFPEQYKE